MNALKLVFTELVGMFVDDGSLALFATLLIAGIAALVKLAGLAPEWGAVLLLLGCLALLTESTQRAARRQKS